MSAIATKNSICSGHGGFPSRPPVESESLLKINGIDVLVDANQYAQHSDGNSTHGGQAMSTRPWFSVNGKAVVCVGDPVSCGSIVAAGDALVQIS
ncbi:TPA: alanine racemase [Salmonella enterica]|uniref:Alanine racemase n=1 Tax=Salmonella enterica TaxID=28901 RepID=A0A747SWE7_SALER|nr:alanine racemase [Salmonella enterica]